MACNTSANQFFAASVSRDGPSPLNLNRFPSYQAALQGSSQSSPLNLTSTMLLWEAALVSMLWVLSPLDGTTSIFYPVLGANNLSSFSINYSCISHPQRADDRQFRGRIQFASRRSLEIAFSVHAERSANSDCYLHHISSNARDRHESYLSRRFEHSQFCVSESNFYDRCLCQAQRHSFR